MSSQFASIGTAMTSSTVTYDKKFNSLDAYVAENSLRVHPVLLELREYTNKNVPLAKMLTDPVEGQFFCMLLRMLGAKKCLEVGTYTGYNALNCALTIPADGVVYALDNNEEYVKHGYPFFEKSGVKDKIKVQIGDAIESMDTLIKEGHSETFDFIYVDADKMAMLDYVDRAYTLLRLGGIVALDNTLLDGMVTRLDEEQGVRFTVAAAVHNANQKVKVDERFQLSFLNIADGVTLLRKRNEWERDEYN